jgi:hypothetical protein
MSDAITFDLHRGRWLGAVYLRTSSHETASFAPIASMRSEEASHGALAKIRSTRVSIQFLRRLDDRRFGVSRGARVYRPARVRLSSGSDGRAGRLSLARQEPLVKSAVLVAVLSQERLSQTLVSLIGRRAPGRLSRVAFALQKKKPPEGGFSSAENSF